MSTVLNKGSVLVISGPSGCGKSSLLKILSAKVDFYFSISTTTRAPRVGEKEGVDYFFVSKEEFLKDIQNDNFLEYASVHDNYYGTSLKPVYSALSEGKLIVFDIDVQGHDLVRAKINELTTSIFITTPNLSQLAKRLTSRQTDTFEVIENRINNSKIELKSIDKYDYIIINDDLNEAAKELISIAKACKNKSSIYSKEDLIKSWLD
jgi:guanylate kinase